MTDKSILLILRKFSWRLLLVNGRSCAHKPTKILAG